MQTASATTDSLYRALRSAQADPDLAHAAVGDVADMAGQNVVTEIRADVEGLRSELKATSASLRAEMADLRTELRAEIADVRMELGTEIASVRMELGTELASVQGGLKTLHARLDEALRGQHQLNRILVGVFAAAVFGSLALQGYSIFFR